VSRAVVAGEPLFSESGSVCAVPAEETRSFRDGVVLRWRGPLTDEEMADLVASHGGTPVAGWWDRIRPQRRGVATRVVRFATEHAHAAGCEWLHVDFDDHLGAFYFDACGFTTTSAGLINLRSL
jgi:hypothetical protein